MKKIFAILFFTLLFTSCEEVIYVPLNSADPAIVIEGQVTNYPGPYQVRITTTTDFYDPSTVPPVNNATVYVEDDLGHSWYFTEQRPGYYNNDQFTGEPGRTYSLNVKVKDRFYHATSYMPPPVSIDSLDQGYFAGTRFADAGYYIILYFTDPPDTTNYYRIRLYKGDQAGTVIYVLDDQLMDGNPVNLLLFGSAYEAGDTAVVELQSIDEKVYRFLLTLSNVNASSPSGPEYTPANPETNLSGEALGYFGAVSLSRDTIILTHSK